MSKIWKTIRKTLELGHHSFHFQPRQLKVDQIGQGLWRIGKAVVAGLVGCPFVLLKGVQRHQDTDSAATSVHPAYVVRLLELHQGEGLVKGSLQ
jgi:hypothetical protein